jgi:hypothetical protein
MGGMTMRVDGRDDDAVGESAESKSRKLARASLRGRVTGEG